MISCWPGKVSTYSPVKSPTSSHLTMLQKSAWIVNIQLFIIWWEIQAINRSFCYTQHKRLKDDSPTKPFSVWFHSGHGSSADIWLEWCRFKNFSSLISMKTKQCQKKKNKCLSRLKLVNKFYSKALATYLKGYRNAQIHTYRHTLRMKIRHCTIN